MSGEVGVVVVVGMVFKVWVQTLLQLEVFIAESAGGDEERPGRRRASRKRLPKDSVKQGGFCRWYIAAVGAAASVTSVTSG